jgi:hypothetical protein
MATVNPALASPQRTRRRALLAGLALVAGLLAYFWGPLKGYAIGGVSYGARIACSCKFLGGRSLEDCRKDFEPGMELVMLSADAEAKSVTATFPLLASQTARFHPGEGCRLDPWEG